MPDITNPELCSFITMCVNHPKISTFKKLNSPLGLLGLKSFYEFVILGR